jgi:uncharacterized protein (TIGR00725 family)
MQLAPRIAVVGERDASRANALEAEHVGREIALRGGILICGGMDGVMEAAARGCKSAGGITIGIIPSVDADDANPHIMVPIVTGMGEGRNIIVVRSAQAVIAIGGSYGTLSEIALALRLNIPVIGLHTWVFSREQPDERDPVIRAANAQEAVDQAWSALADQ